MAKNDRRDESRWRFSRQPDHARLRLPAQGWQDFISGDSVVSACLHKEDALSAMVLAALNNPKQKTRRDGSRRVQLLLLAGPGTESAQWQSVNFRLAGDPSEVTALGVRHWITSFRC